MNDSIFPQILYVVEKYDVVKVKFHIKYDLLGCAAYFDTFGVRHDVMVSDISKTAFHSEKLAWEAAELKILALQEWVKLNIERCERVYEFINAKNIAQWIGFTPTFYTTRVRF